MSYKRLRIAFCLGLLREARIVERILSDKGFDTVSAICKVGRVPKENIGLNDDQKIDLGKFESMCNPVDQVYLLNAAKTDLNIALGWCMGHDPFFPHYSEAFCTVLAVKDRMLGNNPIAVVYTLGSYYRSIR